MGQMVSDEPQSCGNNCRRLESGLISPLNGGVRKMKNCVISHIVRG